MNVKSIPEKGKLFLGQHFIVSSLIISAILGLLAMLFFSTSISPLYESFSYDPVDVDSNFFYYTGKLVAEGKIPYLDFTDHKGVLVFYVNALAYLMG